MLPSRAISFLFTLVTLIRKLTLILRTVTLCLETSGPLLSESQGVEEMSVLGQGTWLSCGCSVLL